jgi:hypothetical protein
MTKLTIKEWLLENFEMDEIKDIRTHGCIGGVAGLTYYTETVEFHDEHEEEIWDLLFEHAENQGKTTLELIAELKNQEQVVSMTKLKNLLCWLSVEVKASEIIDELEGEECDHE